MHYDLQRKTYILGTPTLYYSASMRAHFTVMGFSTYAKLLFVFVMLAGFCLEFSPASDILYWSQSIRDQETVSSVDGSLKVGFFSPRNSTNRYVGCWYLSPSNVVWVANKDNPLRDSSGVTISENGNLVVLNGKRQLVWSSNESNIAFNSTAKVQNSGNLVLLDNATSETVWESFQHPSHTLMPKMILSTNEKTGKKIKVTSWKSPSDPSDGNFSASLENLRVPELFAWNQRRPYWRSGPWNGEEFIGYPNMRNLYSHGVTIGRDEDGTVHLTHIVLNEPLFNMMVLDSQGQFYEN